MIYSASSVWANYKFDDSFKFVKSQSLFFIVGKYRLWYNGRRNADEFIGYATGILGQK